MSVAGKRLSFFLVELKSHKTLCLLPFYSRSTVFYYSLSTLTLTSRTAQQSNMTLQDDVESGEKDLQKYTVSKKDVFDGGARSNPKTRTVRVSMQ
jgi:hypothetical protein